MAAEAPPSPATGAAPAALPERQVPCPCCGRPSLYAPANRWRPFCSERCRSLDLGAWAQERYRVAAPPAAPGSGPVDLDAD